MTAASSKVRLTAHALQRWQERVDTGATLTQARLELDQFVSCGRARPTPRHWTHVKPTPGLTFVYCAQRPSVCALVVGGVVVTVLTRALYRATAPRGGAALHGIGQPRKDRSRRMVPVSAWRWDGKRAAS